MAVTYLPTQAIGDLKTGRAGISCNVVAGVHHDHLFVPVEQARQAMDALHALSRSTA